MNKKEKVKKNEVTFNPYILCPDWDKLSGRDLEVVFRWFSDRGSCYPINYDN